MEGFSVVLFFSNNYSIWASNVLKKNDVSHRMIPVPRHLSSECGYCVRFNSDDDRRVRGLLETAGVEYDRIEII